MTTETVNLSGLIQPLTPVMTLGSTNIATSTMGTSARLINTVSVSGQLKAQARRIRLPEWTGDWSGMDEIVLDFCSLTIE